MFRFVVLAACLALCKGHAVVPVADHTAHDVVAPYHHGYAGFGHGLGHVGGHASGYGSGLGVGHGLSAGHGLVAGHGLGHGYGTGLGIGTGFSAGYGLGAGLGSGSGLAAGHGFGAGSGVGSGFAAGHGLIAGHAHHGLGHHILKRSPHFVVPLAHQVPLIVAPVHVEPVAVSHQQRVDFHGSHALPVVPFKPIVAPYLHGAPLLHKYFGAGHYGAGAY